MSDRKSRLIPIVRSIILLGLALLLLFFAFRGVSLRKVYQEILKSKAGWVLLSLLISLVALVVRAHRWNFLIEPLGYRPTLRNTTYSVMVGYFANLAFPRLGEITRCGSLSTAEGIPFNKLLGTVVVERIIDVLSLLLCIFIVGIIEFNRLGNFLSKNLAEPLLGRLKTITSTNTGVVSLVGGLLLVIVLLVLFIRYSKRKSGTKWAAMIDGFLKGLMSIRNLKKPWLFIFHSLFIWVLYYLSVYVCLFALPFTSNLGLSAALFLLVAGGIGMSAPVQGGIGAYHLLVSQGLLLYGISLEDGLSFATLLHSLQLVTVIVTGSIALLALSFQRKRMAQAAATGSMNQSSLTSV
jgi:glycosyltransferase 2 family protein